jgi:hypothetical protein
VDENIRNGWYFSRAAELQAQIDADVKADSNKFYSYQNFLDNLTVTVGGTGGMKAYPGLKELMEARMNYLDTYPGFHGEPVISQTAYEPGIPAAGEPCWITARINGAPRAYLGYRFKPDGPFSKTTLFDDGLHHDGTAGDGIFGAMILPEGNLVRYYYYAENDSAAALLPERAEYEFFTIKLKIKKGDVVINEVTGSQNGVGWIEIFNTTGENLSVAGMRLSFDVISSVGHFLPDTIIPPKSYLTMNATLFSDDPESQTRWNTSLSGGAILLFNSSGDQVDSVSYGYLTDGKSSGRWPNGYGTLTYMTPTRGKYNTMGSTPSSGFNLFPNPARDVIFIEFKAGAEPVTYKMFTTSGQLAGQGGESPVMGGTSRILPVPISGLRAGLYFLQLDNQGIKTTKKFIVY